MTAVALATSLAPGTASRPDSAFSPEGKFAREQVAKVWDALNTAVSLQPPHASLLEQLDALVAEHSAPGWDGQEAPPVSVITAGNAKKVIRALPADIPAPELAVDPDDGAISFEWHGGYRKVFSFSVGIRGRLACAGVNGTDRWHAVLGFDGERLPALALASIRQVLA